MAFLAKPQLVCLHHPGSVSAGLRASPHHTRGGWREIGSIKKKRVCGGGANNLWQPQKRKLFKTPTTLHPVYVCGVFLTLGFEQCRDTNQSKHLNWRVTEHKLTNWGTHYKSHCTTLPLAIAYWRNCPNVCYSWSKLHFKLQLGSVY